MSDGWYVLDDKNKPVLAKTGAEAMAFRKDFDRRRVGLTQIHEGCEVSTVFLGLDHSFGDGPPILFETLVFGGPFDQEMDRYCTWDEAVAGHARMVEKCQPIMTENVP